MSRTIPFSLLFVASLAGVFAQNEAELKDYFEGRHVLARMDMPGDKSGVDLRVEQSRQVDYAELGRRLKRYGVAIRRGERVMITLVKVNKRNIEFQLAGGGYGTFSDTSTMPSIDTHLSKSQREKSLEEDIQKETDPGRKKRLKAELDRLRTEREREEARLEAEAAQATIMAEARERELRSSSGSRFNLWFDETVPRETLTPEAVMAALTECVEFPEEVEETDRGRTDEERGSPSSFVLKKGVTEQEINRVYGQPVHRDTERVRDLTVVNSTYELDDRKLEAVFVEGVLVRYSMVSR